MVFFYLYDYHVLNPTYVTWLYGTGDKAQHYLGWVAFRNSDWTFPIGLTNQLSYPAYTSVVYTDSLPLFAIFFKLLSPILPENFQYFGLWRLLTYVLNGLVSAKLFQRFFKNNLVVLLSSCFFIFSVPVLQRIAGHEALAAHWILFLALILFFSYDRLSISKKTLYWGLMGFFIPSLHMYYLPMCGIILLGACIAEILHGNPKNWKTYVPCLSYVAVYCAAAYLMMYLLGTGSSAIGGGLGEYSFNLNGYFNSQGTSRFLKALETTSSFQSEGLAYLGAGILLLLAFDLVLFLCAGRAKFQSLWKQHKPLLLGILIIFVLSIVIAASPTVTLGSKTLFTLALPDWFEQLWATFRATGRFAWIGMYCIMLLSILAIKFAPRPKLIPVLLTIAIVVQVVDISPYMTKKKTENTELTQIDATITTTLDEIINTQGIEHFVFVDDWDTVYFPIATYALEHQITLNTFYFARAYAIQEVDLTDPNSDTLYIWRTDSTDTMPNTLYYRTTEDFVFGYTES